MGVYRSLNGSSYSLVGTVLLGTLTFTDTGLDPSTLYYYKLSDDGGSTFSSVVTVTTQACNGLTTGARNATALPRASGDGVDSNTFNDLVDLLESTQVQTEDPTGCAGCVVGGALILDYSICECYTVNVTEDITSITLQGCENRKHGCLELVIADGASFSVCGFPTLFGFDTTASGCNTTITGGPGGSRYRFDFTACVAEADTGMGSPAGLAPLTLDCEATDTGAAGCQIKCDADPDLNFHNVQLNANGGQQFTGREPYNFTCTAGLLWVTSSSQLLCDTGVVPGDTLQAGPGAWWGTCPDKDCVPDTHFYDAITAFDSHWMWNSGIIGPPNCCSALGIKSDLFCDGSFGSCVNSSPAPAGSPLCTVGSDGTCSTDISCTTPLSTAAFNTPLGTTAVCAGCGSTAGKLVDVRTADMKAQGCCPCKSGANAVITVTDALGQSVSVTITDVGA